MRFSGIVLAAMLAVSSASLQAQSKAGPQGEPRGPLREQAYLVPNGSGLFGERYLHAVVRRPPGEQPLPLVVINHGSPGEAGKRQEMEVKYTAASEWFVKQGFVVVLPLRRGYGATGGEWAETYGRCSEGDFYRGGLASADDIDATIRYMREQSFVQKDRVIIVGQSAGGWGAIAATSRPQPGVIAAINFAGGRGGHMGGSTSQNANANCRPDRLISAAGEYGKTATVPTLWIYTENDSFFDPDLSKKMFDAYAAGSKGAAKYVLLPAFGKDGHQMFDSNSGVRRWESVVLPFLAALK
jgi:dienelactone hydrolase